MRTETHVNRHLVESVKVTALTVPPVGDLLTLTVTEREGAHETVAAVTMRADLWQQVADALAEHGVVATAAEPAAV